ncbi:MAG: winged helix-turn-helix transcriptional regulator [Clostridiales bacterium]|nr:winged helix-turn-helix transcriptional regulator [Clostridiales bacterium]
MKTEELINAIAVVAEPVRIQILNIIAAHGELKAKDILPAFDITQPTLSHHMSVLESSGLVSARREGRCVYYSLNMKTFASINEFFMGFTDPEVAAVNVSKSAKAAPAPAPAEKPSEDKAKKKKDKDKEKDKDKKKKDKKKKK